MNDEEFEELVSKAIDNLPNKNLKALDNVAIVVEDWPTSLQLQKGRVTRGTLFGLYEGIPKTVRGNNYTFVSPDKITIFKGPLTRAALNKDHLERLVSNTVWHEVAHHFGLGHDQIHALEEKAKLKKQFSGSMKFETAKNLDKLNIANGWFGRSGGVSQFPFESLNVSLSSGDRPEYVEENIRRAVSTLNLDRTRLVHLLKLAHGNKVYVARAKDAGRQFDGYDAVVTDVMDLPLALNIADCLAIFLYDPNNKAIGLAHAGWRGLDAKVITSTIRAMTEHYDTEPKDLIAAIGPGAEVKSFEVGKDVADLFPSKVIKTKDQKFFLDVKAQAKSELEENDVKDIEVNPRDSITDDEYFSFRRNKTPARNINIISL